MPTTLREILEHKQITRDTLPETYEYYKIVQNEDGTSDFLVIEVLGNPPSTIVKNVPPGSVANTKLEQENTRSQLLAKQFVEQIIKEYSLEYKSDIFIDGISKIIISPSGLIKLANNESIKSLLHNIYPILKSIENLCSDQPNTIICEVGECLLDLKPFFGVKQELNTNYKLNIPFKNEEFPGLRQIFIDNFLLKIKQIFNQSPDPLIKELTKNISLEFRENQIRCITGHDITKSFHCVVDMMLYYYLLDIAADHIVISDQLPIDKLQKLQLAKFHVINKRNQDQQKWYEFAHFYIKTTSHLDLENDKEPIVRLFDQLLKYDDDLVRVANEQLSTRLNNINLDAYPRKQIQSFNTNDCRLKKEEWSIIIRRIRENAFEKLSTKVATISDDSKAIELLQFYRNKPLFNTHRSYGFFSFFSRIGRTASVVKIDELIEKRQKNKVAHDNGIIKPLTIH